ncbi:MAG: aminotransferase class V-fold PLP-dependent enzyme [Intestinimonas sp.]|jgi:cysteine desulfurase family protein|nr:aminotransferase class V-fold PLP-dependent enzyme [Intestinimonas sp.]
MIYLDAAATTLQKPPEVRRAVMKAIETMASPGRGSHRPAMLAADTAFACRQAAAELFQVKEPDHVVFTLNATHGLNIAIHSVVHPGDTVLISGYEHNAVTRTLAALDGVTVKIAAAPLFKPDAMLRAFDRAFTKEVSAVVCTHVSNVFGYELPIADIAALCQQHQVPLIVDASQSAGCLPVHMDELGAAFIAMPGHKGLFGPQGTGLLLCGDVPAQPLLMGGTGSISAIQEMPEFLPDRLEAGTQNIAGIAGLLEGIHFIQRHGTAWILEHERSLAARAASRLSGYGVHTFVSPGMAWQIGVLSFQVTGMDCEAVAEQLGDRGIAVRAGLHCAPLAHRSAGTYTSGTVRASFSPFNTERDADTLARTVAAL